VLKRLFQSAGHASEEKPFDYIPRDVREGTTADYWQEQTPDLLTRWSRHHDWWQGRLDAQMDSYQKFTDGAVGTEIVAHYRNGRKKRGVNFASQEYLSLSTHPKIVAACRRAAKTYGVHSAGSATLMGNTALSVALEKELAAFLGYADCTLFPIGWAAGYGVIKTLVRRTDHVIIDILAHACLQEAARDATANVHKFRHCSTESAARRLAQLRAQAPEAGILVVTETLFSMDSDVPDIAALIELCKGHRATLMVDCAHDLGAIGPTGRGFLELQGVVGKPDILMGSFSKTFASIGGFVACNNPALKTALRFSCGPCTFTNAMTPLQAAVIRTALQIVDSNEGRARRERLMENAVTLRRHLKEEGFELIGQPSAIVPVVLEGATLSRLATRYAFEQGAIVNLVEYPAVARNDCRWRVQVMASHTPRQLRRFADIAAEARDRAARHARFLDDVDGASAPLKSARVA
jgi:glycine C-acetyltransferase